jgi:hypothetical protein
VDNRRSFQNERNEVAHERRRAIVEVFEHGPLSRERLRIAVVKIAADKDKIG